MVFLGESYLSMDLEGKLLCINSILTKDLFSCLFKEITLVIVFEEFWLILLSSLPGE
jgi:hypothetical protein